MQLSKDLSVKTRLGLKTTEIKNNSDSERAETIRYFINKRSYNVHYVVVLLMLFQTVKSNAPLCPRF